MIRRLFENVEEREILRKRIEEVLSRELKGTPDEMKRIQESIGRDLDLIQKRINELNEEYNRDHEILLKYHEKYDVIEFGKRLAKVYEWLQVTKNLPKYVERLSILLDKAEEKLRLLNEKSGEFSVKLREILRKIEIQQEMAQKEIPIRRKLREIEKQLDSIELRIEEEMK